MMSSEHGAVDAQSYEREVLRLSHTEEEDLERLQAEAKELGVDVDTTINQRGKVSPAVSTSTMSTAPRRSESNTSLRSCSTGFTSIFSRRDSKDLRFTRSSMASVQNLSTSATDGDGDSVSVLSIPLSPRSINSSAAHSRSNSIISEPRSPASFQLKTFSVKRGFRTLSKLRRPGSSTDSLQLGCYSCPDAPAHPRPVYRLLCYHSLCHPHLRQLVLDALKTENAALLYCCGKQMSNSLLEAVTTASERIQLYEMLDTFNYERQNTDHESLFRDGTSRKNSCASSIPVKDLDRLRISFAVGTIDLETSRDQLNAALEHEDVQQLYEKHRGERDRFLAFESRQKQAMSEDQDAVRKELAKAQAELLEALHDTQPQALAKLEDRHISAEMDLRDTHEQEKRSCYLKLRHMEAYCGGHDPEGTGRTVTAQDMKELELQYWIRDNLDQRHQSTINVLREQQAREMRVRAQKQEVELAATKKRHERDMKSLCQAQDVARRDFDDICQQRKARLITRWNLEKDIWQAKRCKEDQGFSLRLPIANPDWLNERHE